MLTMQTENPAGDICHHAAGRCSVRRVNKLCEDALQRQMKTLPSFLPAHGLRGCSPTTSKSCYGLASFPISRTAAESSCARSAGLKTKKQCKGASWRFWPLLGFNARVSLEERLRQAGCVFFYSPEISHALAAFLQALAQPLRSVWCSRHAGLFSCLSSSAGCPRGPRACLSVCFIQSYESFPKLSSESSCGGGETSQNGKNWPCFAGQTPRQEGLREASVAS